MTKKPKIEPAFYAIIPADVRYAKIVPNAKLLYGEITALCHKEGFCWATNSYFAELYGVALTTVSEWVNILVKHNFIDVEITDKTHRKLYLTLREKPNPPSGKAEGYPSGKAEDNNTSVNNTVKSSAAEPHLEKKLFDLFYETINPTISFNNKTEWAAARELFKKFGLEKTLKTAEYAISVHGKLYAPSIATPYQLKVKLPDLMAFYKKNNVKQETTLIL